MTYFIFSLLVIFNVIFGFRHFHKKSYRLASKIILITTFIGFFLLISGYRNYSGLSSDLSNNEFEYIRVSLGNKSAYEPLYVLLMKIGSLFKLDFYTWRSIMTAFSLILIFQSVKKWTSNPHLVLAFFGSYLVIVSAEQFRNFLASSIFIYGLIIFIYSNHRYKKIGFLIFTVLSGLIHSVFYIYLFIVLIDKMLSIKKIWIILFPTFILIIVMFINGNKLPGLEYILNLLDNSQVAIYLRQSTRFGFLYPFILHLSSTIMTYYVYIKSKQEIHKKAYKINLLMIIVFPLYILQVAFFRISRNLLLITYISESGYITNQNLVKRKLLTIFLSFMLIFLWVYINLIIFTDPKAVLIPFFEDNIYF